MAADERPVLCNVYVKRLDDDSVIHTIPIHSRMSESTHERFLTGLMRKVDQENFYVDDSEIDAMMAGSP